MIEAQTPKVLDNLPEVYALGSPYWNTQEYYQTQYQLITSRPVAERAASMLGLRTEELIDELLAAGPENLEASANGDPLAGLSDELRSKLGFLGLAGRASRGEMLEALRLLDIAAFLQGRIQVEPARETRLVHVGVEDVNPERAALIANAVADAYIELNLDQKLDATRAAADWLSDQIEDHKAKLEASELALHEFKRQNQLVSVSIEDRRSMASQTLSLLNERLASVHADRLAQGSWVDRLRHARDTGDVEGLADVVENSLIGDLKQSRATLQQEEAQLLTRYTDKHQAVISVRQRIRATTDALRREVEGVLEREQSKLQALMETENRLNRAIDQVKDEALEVNRKEIDLNRLTRERDQNQALYDILIRRQKEADLSRMLRVNNVRKLEDALVPRVPVRPKVLLNLAATLLLGLLLGLGAVFLVDYADNSVKTQEHVEDLVGLPFLGLIPTVKEGNADSDRAASANRDLFIADRPRSVVAECCRSVRTNLLFMSPDEPPHAILITSSEPREGKSFTAINLAITMAQSGSRTVVVDTDLRRPRLHQSFGIPSLQGISTALVHEARLEEVIFPSKVPGLDVIPCGPIPPNPAELFHTEGFAEILRRLRERYDRVIFDSPPVGVVTDASVLAAMVDGVVLVAQAGHTTIPALRQVKSRITNVGGRIYGVVLNDVDLDRKEYATYSGYYYYRSGYGDGPAEAGAASG